LCNGLRARGDGGQLIVRNDADEEDGLARFDFVAGGEHSLLNLGAIQMGPVGAPFVDDAATVGAAFDGEVHAGHMIVVWNGKLRTIRRAADEQGLAGWKRNLSTRKWSSSDFENHAHSMDSKLVFEATCSQIS